MNPRAKKIVFWVVILLIVGVVLPLVLTQVGSGHGKSPNHVPVAAQTTSG